MADPIRQAEMDGFFDGIEWAIDNLLWWTFIIGLASGLVFSFALMVVIVWLI